MNRNMACSLHARKAHWIAFLYRHPDGPRIVEAANLQLNVNALISSRRCLCWSSDPCHEKDRKMLKLLKTRKRCMTIPRCLQGLNFFLMIVNVVSQRRQTFAYNCAHLQSRVSLVCVLHWSRIWSTPISSNIMEWIPSLTAFYEVPVYVYHPISVTCMLAFYIPGVCMGITSPIASNNFKHAKAPKTWVTSQPKSSGRLQERRQCYKLVCDWPLPLKREEMRLAASRSASSLPLGPTIPNPTGHPSTVAYGIVICRSQLCFGKINHWQG